MNKLNLNSTLLKASALSAAVAPATGLAAEKSAPRTDRPNIVVIVADDLLSSELSCYGGKNIETPNIDRLAREGVRFTHNYASIAMSVPIRASMYTGLYPVRHGSYQNHKATFKGTKTVNEYMPEEGYRVGRTGKNHPITPAVYKFEKVPGFTVGCTALKAPYTVDGIREFMTRNDDPFLLYVCSIHPHAPWTWGDPTEFDKDKLVMPENCVDNPRMREIFTHYLAEVRALDNEVGSVLEVLTETGKLDNTIVMFLGEQGPQFPGGKWTCWYPGVNSALVARYPAKIAPGRVSHAIVQYEDLLPTFLDIAGGKPRKELDGVSFKKALFGESDKARKYAYGIHNNIPEGRPYPDPQHPRREIRADLEPHAYPTPSCSMRTCCPRSSTSQAASRGRSSTASASRRRCSASRTKPANTPTASTTTFRKAVPTRSAASATRNTR